MPSVVADSNSQIKALRSSSPAAILAGNGTLTGEIIDRQGYDGLEFLILLGALTDATYTCTVYEDSASNMATETAAADKDLIGQTNAFVINGADADNDNRVLRVGYKGAKRYSRLKIVQTGATTGGYVCSCAVQSSPRYSPVADQVADV